MTHKELIVAISKRTGYSKAVVEIIISAYINIAVNEFREKNQFNYVCSAHCAM